MYVEQLTTNPESTDLLWDKILELSQTPDQLERAELVCQAVHESVEPISAKIGSIALSDSILKQRRSNCYGLNTVLSEAYEVADVPHYLVFANGHVFTLVSDAQSYAHVFDAHIPEFNGHVELAIPQRHLQQIPSQIEEYGRAFVKMYSTDIVANSKLNRSFSAVAAKNPWVTHASANINQDYRDFSETKERQNVMLWTSLFPPVTGRPVLDNYAQFRTALSSGQTDAAFSRLRSIKGLYPEIDHRSQAESQVVGQLALRLARSGRLEDAQEAIDVLELSYEISDDTVNRAWAADQYRKLGTILGKPELIEESILRYELAYDQKPSRLIAEKLAKARRLLQACSSTPRHAIIDAKLPETVAATSA